MTTPSPEERKELMAEAEETAAIPKHDGQTYKDAFERVSKALTDCVDELSRREQEHQDEQKEVEALRSKLYAHIDCVVCHSPTYDEEIRKAYDAGFEQGWYCAHNGKLCGSKDHPYNPDMDEPVKHASRLMGSDIYPSTPTDQPHAE